MYMCIYCIWLWYYCSHLLPYTPDYPSRLPFSYSEYKFISKLAHCRRANTNNKICTTKQKNSHLSVLVRATNMLKYFFCTTPPRPGPSEPTYSHDRTKFLLGFPFIKKYNNVRLVPLSGVVTFIAIVVRIHACIQVEAIVLPMIDKNALDGHDPDEVAVEQTRQRIKLQVRLLNSIVKQPAFFVK